MECLVPWSTVLEADSRCVGQYIPHRLGVAKLYHIYSKIHPWISIIKSVEQPHAFTLYFMRSLCYEGWADNKFTWRIIPGLKNRPDCGYVRGIRPRVIVIYLQPLKNLCCHILKDNFGTETAVTRWLLTQGIG
jgi:hypothetical protein